MTDELRAQLAAAMAVMAGLAAQVLGKNSAIGSLVSEAESMWNSLETTFKQAVQTSVLMSVLKNPCLQGAAEAIMPDNMKSVWNDFIYIHIYYLFIPFHSMTPFYHNNYTF